MQLAFISLPGQPGNGERVIGYGYPYTIRQYITFSDDHGYALAEHQGAEKPFATFHFYQVDGERRYGRSHFHNTEEEANLNYASLVLDDITYNGAIEKHRADSGIEPVSVSGDTKEALPAPMQEPEAFKYYSTQRPVDLGTFPKRGNAPTEIVNFDSRIPVENGKFTAWGYLIYAQPLTAKQMEDYELVAAPSNPDAAVDKPGERAPKRRERSSVKALLQECREEVGKVTKETVAASKAKSSKLERE